MGEEIINPEPKQTEFTIQLPDREKQWEKCQTIVRKTKTVTLITREVIDGKETEHEAEPKDEPYLETLMEGEGLNAKLVMLSECLDKIGEAANIQQTKQAKDYTAEEAMKVRNADAIILTFKDSKGDVDEKILKLKSHWGRGCPAFCGAHREFTYSEMTPQTYRCQKCGVTINLV